MAQKFYKSIGFVGIILVIFATWLEIYQWVTTH